MPDEMEYETFDMTLMTAVELLVTKVGRHFSMAPYLIVEGLVKVDGAECRDINKLVYPKTVVEIDWSTTL